jgi:hypothetical protein
MREQLLFTRNTGPINRKNEDKVLLIITARFILAYFVCGTLTHLKSVLYSLLNFKRNSVWKIGTPGFIRNLYFKKYQILIPHKAIYFSELTLDLLLLIPAVERALLSLLAASSHPPVT